jgi:hypothetical protein
VKYGPVGKTEKRCNIHEEDEEEEMEEELEEELDLDYKEDGITAQDLLQSCIIALAGIGSAIVLSDSHDQANNVEK